MSFAATIDRFRDPERDQDSLVYRCAPAVTTRGCILAFHGGCFVGGSTEWDCKQNAMLARAGFEVHQVAFPRTTWHEFKNWASSDDMRDFLENKSATFCGALFVLGRSSGGCLAKYMFEIHSDLIAKAIYLCPVLQPVERAELVPETETATQAYFGANARALSRDDKRRLKRASAERELIIGGKRDARVPLKCFSLVQRKQMRFLRPETHSAVCTCTSQEFGTTVASFLCN